MHYLQIPSELLAVRGKDFFLCQSVQVFSVEQQSIHIEQAVRDCLQRLHLQLSHKHIKKGMQLA